MVRELTIAGEWRSVKGCVPLVGVSLFSSRVGLLGDSLESQATRCRSGLSSSDVITITQIPPGVKWTVGQSGTVLPRSLGMTGVTDSYQREAVQMCEMWICVLPHSCSLVRVRAHLRVTCVQRTCG